MRLFPFLLFFKIVSLCLSETRSRLQKNKSKNKTKSNPSMCCSEIQGGREAAEPSWPARALGTSAVHKAGESLLHLPAAPVTPRTPGPAPGSALSRGWHGAAGHGAAGHGAELVSSLEHPPLVRTSKGRKQHVADKIRTKLQLFPRLWPKTLLEEQRLQNVPVMPGEERERETGARREEEEGENGLT